MIKIFLGLILCVFCLSNANADLIVKINRAEIGALPIMIYLDSNDESLGSKIKKIIETDLHNSGYFNVLSSSSVKNNISNSKTQYALWTLAGANYFLKSKIYTENSKKYIRFDLHNVIKKEIIISYKINLGNNNIRKISHTISNVIFEKITGIKGIFDTKIAYISTEVVKKRKIYKLNVADIDGYNPIAIYKSSKQIMSPTWSPNNKKIAYVSFENNKPEIFIQTLETGLREKLPNNNYSSSAPAWSPNEKYMAFTSSIKGNLEIFVYNFYTKSIKRVTNSIGIDTEAEWDLDSEKIFFTSDRNGKPHIYSKSIKRGKAKRITFQGNYNADANLSPNGHYLSLVHNGGSGHNIAIYSLKDKYFKIISTGKLDEAPSFAPNNKMILFASKKQNKGILVATSNDGRIRTELELDGEDVREPIWSH